MVAGIRGFFRLPGALVFDVFAFPWLIACAHVAPPVSPFPTANAALERMRATYACARGIRGEAKIDHFSEQGRIRGTLLFFAVAPAQVRFDAVSPFGATIATLTSDGRNFALADLREKKFFQGPASTCNIARLTHVPIPGSALVELLHGEAPVLAHGPAATSLRWDPHGYYVLEIAGTRQAQETIHLVPTPTDFQRPWSEQRVRVLDVRVRQQGYELYHAELDAHRASTTASALVDENGIDPPVLPSGPACYAEIPNRIHVEVAGSNDDVRFRYQDVRFNPPLPEGTFTQPVPGGVSVVPVGSCDHGPQRLHARCALSPPLISRPNWSLWPCPRCSNGFERSCPHLKMSTSPTSFCKPPIWLMTKWLPRSSRRDEPTER